MEYDQSDCLVSILLVVSTFFAHFFTSGWSTTMGVFYVEFLKAFQFSNGVTSCVGSINFAVLCFVAPLSSYLTGRFGAHITIGLGGLLSTIGLLTTAYAPNIFIVFIFLGIITGCGFGLVFTAAIVVINVNVTKWRTVCTGISLSGVGLGTAIFPLISNVLIQNYGWRGALLITSALVLHVCLAAEIVWVATNMIQTKCNVDITLNIEITNETTLKPGILWNGKKCTELNFNKMHCVHDCTKYGTHLCCDDPYNREITIKQGDNSTEEPLLLNCARDCDLKKCFENSTEKVNNNYSLHMVDFNTGLRNDGNSNNGNINRSDINDMKEGIRYSPNNNDDQKHKNNIITADVQLNNAKNTSIWEIPDYWAIQINTLLFSFGQSVIFTHIVAFAKVHGISIFQASTLISTVGVTGIIGKILLGLASHHPSINTTFLLISSYFTAGLSTIGYCLWINYNHMLICVAVLGFCLAAYGPLLTEVVYSSVGHDHFSIGYGYVLCVSAVGTLLGAPSAGWLYDITHEYHYSFYLGGVTFLLSTVPLICTKCVHYLNDNRK